MSTKIIFLFLIISISLTFCQESDYLDNHVNEVAQRMKIYEQKVISKERFKEFLINILIHDTHGEQEKKFQMLLINEILGKVSNQVDTKDIPKYVDHDYLMNLFTTLMEKHKDDFDKQHPNSDL